MGTQPLTIQSLTYLPAWQGPLPGIGEFGALLNTITDAAVVLDRSNRQAIFCNQGFLELAGLDPLSPEPFSIDALLPDFGDGWSSGEEHETEVHFPAGRKMAVWASVSWLDKPGHWLLLHIVPLNVHQWRGMQSHREQDLLSYMEELAQINGQPDLDAALDLVLRVGARMLAAQGLCVYRANMQERNH